METYDNIISFIDDCIKLVPKENNLNDRLESIKSSVLYSAPELIDIRIRQIETILNDAIKPYEILDDCPEWHRKLLARWKRFIFIEWKERNSNV